MSSIPTPAPGDGTAACAQLEDIVYSADAERRLLQWNPRLEAVTGLGPEALRGRHLLELVHPDDHPAVRQAMGRLRQHGRVHLQAALRGPDGRPRPFHWLSRAVYDQEGRLTGSVGVGRDLELLRHDLADSDALRDALAEAIAQARAREALEARLRESLRRLELQRQALDRHAIVAITDADGTIRYVNDRFCAISGYAREELIGQNHRLLKSGRHPDAFYRDMWATISAGEVWQGEVCNRAKDGRLYWVDTTIVPQLDENGLPQAYVSVRTDISAKKAREAHLARARDQALLASQLKSEFMTAVSHELNTPLHTMLGVLQLLTLDEELSPWRDHLQDALRAGEQLHQQIQALTDFARLEQGRLTWEARPFPLREVVAEALEPARRAARAKGLDFHLHWRAPAAPWVQGDAERLRQILQQLLSNAVKFSERGAVQLTVEDAGEGAWRFAVRDEGPGIPEDRLELVFEPFTQARGGLSRPHGGAGLGLTLAARLCELMGGRLSLESREGQGSLFTAHLPLPVVVRGVDDGGRPLQGRRALVVDDEPVAARALGLMLEELGAEVTTVDSGRAALERVETDAFHLVFVDLIMPDMDGAELARTLRAHPRAGGLPLVGVSKLAARHCPGLDALLEKPVTADVLLPLVRRLIEEKAP